MTIESPRTAKDVRAQLGHPVIDADGHTIEVTPVLRDYIKELGGPKALSKFAAMDPTTENQRSSYEDRRDSWNRIPVHWSWPAHTLDRATAALPRLYYERLDEIGIDVSLVYPTFGLRLQMIPDDELRPTVCRAVNMYMSELHDGLSDRLLPIAAIPMHTPEEAIAELEYAVNALGMRAVLIPSFVRRPIPRVHREHPEYDDVAFRFDTYGIDSEYDYDPFWEKCVELKVVPSVHTPTNGVGFRRSPSNYVYNHIGSFATSCEALCKSLVMGGVFHRFPELRVAALEGGAAWAVSLYADFLGHWEKRNRSVIDDLDPARLDHELLMSLLTDYGGDRVRAKIDQVLDSIVSPGLVPDELDEFRACPFESPEDVRDLFTGQIYVGCEADDPLTALAFDAAVNPFGARFRVVLGSDISHWDVPDVSEVIEEAYGLVEQGLITEGNFQEFAFSNAATLYAGTKPDFFRGTRVESQVAEFLGQDLRQP